MTATSEYYSDVLDAGRLDGESLTVLVVADATRDEVLGALGAGAEVVPESDEMLEDVDHSAYAVVEVAGGVLAIEQSGYADPAVTTLRQLSEGGRAAAVVRSNIQGHVRFGCARAGDVLFDDDEYMYADDVSTVPGEIRHLFELVWDDLEGDDADDGDDDGADGLTVGLAMAEVITGVALTSDDLLRAQEGPWLRVPSLVYPTD